MCDLNRYRRVVIDCYGYPGYQKCEAWCALEILPLADGRTAVIATEVKDNPGTSITNMCEHLAFWVCRDLGIDPIRLVWIEHYGYPSAFEAGNPRPFDLVEFDLMPAGRDGIFSNPRWWRMTDSDWKRLGLTARQPVEYRQRP